MIIPLSLIIATDASNVSIEAFSANIRNASFWTTGMGMPAPGTEACSVVLGGKIYIIAGNNVDEKVIDIVRIYDSKSNKWNEQAAPLPAAVDHAGAADYNGKIYVVGGFLPGRIPTDKVFIYDPVTNRWQEGQPLPYARGALSVNFVNGILYAIGGIDGSHKVVNKNEAYDPKTDKWTEKAPMPTSRHHHASAVVDGKIYTMGGRVIGNGIDPQINEALSNLNANEMYNPVNDTWTTLEKMPTKRSGLAAAASPINGNIYVFGGQSIDSAFSNTESYNPKTNSWTTELSMPTPRIGAESLAIDEKIFVIGGKTDVGPHVSNVSEIFHVSH